MTVEERLERLERENRRLKYLLFFLLFLMVGAFLAGATRKMGKPGSIPDEIRAYSFTLIDKKGRTRASLEMTEVGPCFAFIR